MKVIILIILEVLEQPLKLLTDPSSRTWWPAILGAVLISATYEIINVHGKKLTTVYREFMLRLFLHPSSLVDLKLIIVRAIVKVVCIASIPFSAKLIAVKVVGLAYTVYGQPPFILTDPSLVIPYSFCFLLISDFSRYLLHRFMHSTSILWRFHQLHHSAEVLTPFSLYRTHPVEQMLQWIRSLLVIGITAGGFAWLSMGKASIWTLYGVPGVMIIFTVLGANLRHSHAWIQYPDWLEYVLISPAQHQQHHSVESEKQRSNYGSVLSIWDLIARSLKRSKEGKPKAFGLLEEHRNHEPRSVISALLDPFKNESNTQNKNVK